MRTVELFCGTKSFSKVAAKLGHSTFTVDSDARHEPNLHINVLALESSALPYSPDILWASPPCTSFSVASFSHYWNRDHTPKSEAALVGIRIAEKTLCLIRETAPRWWFIENPRGMLRHMPFMQGFHRNTISYCQYGHTIMKPTDIWTNAAWWEPRPMCAPGATCHEASSIGGLQGVSKLPWETSGGKAVARGRIPAPLFHEIFSQIPKRLPEHAGVSSVKPTSGEGVCT